MRNKLYRAEIALLAIPVFLLLVQLIFFPELVFDIHLHDTMYVIAPLFFLLPIFLLHLVYWLLHTFLRVKKWRNAAVCAVHTWLVSLALLVSVAAMFLLDQPAPTSTEYITKAIWTRRLYPVTSLAIALFLFSHLVFLLYFLFTVLRKGLSAK